MRVAFDAICLGDGAVTGVARSFLNGLQAHAEHWAGDMVVLAPAGADRSELPDVEVVAAPSGALHRQRRLPRLLRALRADLLHSSVAAVPLRAPCPTIATVHDLPWLHPESGERSTWWRRFATTRSLRAATAVLAPSQFTLDAAARILGSADKLHLAPHITPAPATIGTAADRTGPFLVIGDDRPRKNRDRVRAAHRLAVARQRDLPDLQFVGPPAHYVEETEKEQLLRTCRAVVACSLYEGFGLPVLEALVHGAPLICSDIPPHREIVARMTSPGADVQCIDPTEVEAIAAALARPATGTTSSLTRPAPAELATSWRQLHVAVGAPRRS